jgi:hypothetical protein
VRRGVLGVLLSVSLVSACGGPPSAAAGLLHDEATRICAAADRRLARVGAPGSAPAYQSFLRRGIATLEPELRRLRSLRPQGEERPVFAAALGALAREITELKRAMSALDRHEDPAPVFASLQRRLSPLEADAAAAWRALQVPACLSG